MFGANVKGMTLMAKAAAVTHAGSGERAHIINLSSIVAHRVFTHRAMYGASKAAVNQLTRYLAARARDRTGSPSTPVSPGPDAHRDSAQQFSISPGAATDRLAATSTMLRVHPWDVAAFSTTTSAPCSFWPPTSPST